MKLKYEDSKFLIRVLIIWHLKDNLLLYLKFFYFTRIQFLSSVMKAIVIEIQRLRK